MEELVFKYTREDALNDGVLVDVSGTAKKLGFKYPVAITESLHQALSNIPEVYSHESYEGRLRDVLWMCYLEARKTTKDQMLFKVILHTENLIRENEPPTALKSICHPGDSLEPVITIMFPDED